MTAALDSADLPFMLPSEPPEGHIFCQLCGKAAPRRGNVQKYCVPCSEQKSLETRQKWNKANPERFNKATADRSNTEARLRGAATSATVRQSVCASTPDGMDAPWYVRLAIPYHGSASKNYIFGFAAKGGGHVYKRQQSKDYRAAIALQVKSALKGFKIYQNKVWIDIFVQKPDHKSDAVNVIDMLCDALKEGIGVDDRWFSIGRLDWEIVKGNSQDIHIGICQPDAFDAQACSYCGGIKPLSEFWASKHATNGRNRTCIECRRAEPSKRRKQRTRTAA